MKTLPSYTGVFLKVASSYSNTLQLDTVPAHAHSVYASCMQPGGTTAYKKSGNKGATSLMKKGYASRSVDSSGNKSPTYGSYETAPRHYIANVFIYSGKLNVTDCSANYKYICTASAETHIAGGFDTVCGGHYTACACESDYVWNASTGTCDCDSSKYTLTSCPAGTVCEECGGKYYWDGEACKTGYMFVEGLATCDGADVLDGCHDCETACRNDSGYCSYSDICSQTGNGTACGNASRIYSQCMANCNR